MSEATKPEIVLLSHGGGGVKTQELIKHHIVKHVANPILQQLDDSAEIAVPEKDLVFTTDSYVINPLFFPGGNIGRLAACGTINDMVMQGAKPLYLSLGLILEEGYAVADLDTIMQSFAAVLRETGVVLVTGDTKVVEHGTGHGVFINTAGVGVKYKNPAPHRSSAQPGDVVILTGTMGDHGIAVMSRREGLAMETALASDVAPLWALIEPLLKKDLSIHVMRDPTRGGVAAAVCDIAEASGVCIHVREKGLPIRKEVQGVCDLLGLDPLTVANEGKALIICPAAQGRQVLDLLRAHPLGGDACIIGSVTADPKGLVLLDTKLGGQRVIETPVGELLPRIC